MVGCLSSSRSGMPESTNGPSPHTTVVVHPIVLLAAVDHYNRVAKNTKRRVVGMLLGETHKGVTDVTNSYAVPFEEDERDPNIWRAPPTSPPRQTTAALRPARALPAGSLTTPSTRRCLRC